MFRKAGWKGGVQHATISSVNVVIDFPGEGEKVRAGHYAARVSADGAAEVQLSVDRGDWRPCRESAGYWWCDFWPQPHEIHELRARARPSDGAWVLSQPRACDVIE